MADEVNTATDLVTFETEPKGLPGWTCLLIDTDQPDQDDLT